MPKQPKGDPERQAKLRKVYEALKKVRASTTVTLKPSRFMRETITGQDGTPEPLKLRYYQVQGAYHLLVLKRMVLADDCGLGKTLESIVAFAHMLERDPSVKIMVVTPKSTVRQWASEISRFTTGIRPLIVETPKKSTDISPTQQRKAIYREWADSRPGSNVILITNYALLVRDWNAEGFQPVRSDGTPDPKKPVVPGILDQAVQDAARPGKLVVIWDEAQAFKEMKTKTWEIARFTSDRADRAYALTATLLSSNLMEGYCIYKALKPELFGNKTRFHKDYCHIELKTIPGKKQKIPIVVGYKNLNHYREKIDPFYLGRYKHQVSNELPTVLSKDISCELDRAELVKYDEALTGVLALGDGVLKDYEEYKALVALIYCQQVVDSLTLLRFEPGDLVDEQLDMELFEKEDVKVREEGAKEQALVDLLTGELEGEKVIVYSRFARLVPRLQKVLAKNRIKSVCITGNNSLNVSMLRELGIASKADESREKAQQAFQDPKSGIQVIFITDAGGQGINLQVARATVFYDLPWTWGRYVQTLGRMVRIGSPHKGVAAYHLLAERPGGQKTIDHHVLTLLRKKKRLIDQVLGEGMKDALTFEKDGTSVRDMIRAMQEDVKNASH